MTTKNLILTIARFHDDESGPTAVEYAVLLAMMVGLMIASIILVGNEAQGISEGIVDGLDGALNN
jgi:Flp pilus assembly pilin Flp